MTADQIELTFKNALNLLLNGKLKQSFDKTYLLADEYQHGEVYDRFNELKQNYRYMLQYFVSGVDDPDRKTIYNKLISKLIVLNTQLREELLMRNSTAYEFIQKRYFPHKLHFSSNSDLFDSLAAYHKKTSILKSDIANHEAELQRLRRNFEPLLPDLFQIFWLSTHLDARDASLFHEIMKPDYPGVAEKNLIISALTFNIWRMFDEDKIMLLLDSCQHNDIQVRQRALTGLLFILAKYNAYLPYFPAIRNRLVLLSDDTHITEQLKNIIILIIGTADTDKITRRMKEEILPEVMKISPMIKDRMEAENLMKSEEWEEENPEWSEMLEKSGVADKLKELTDLQMEGADVYMSTFSLLKNFQFFNETAHWFLPFDPEFSAVHELFSNSDPSVLSAFLGNSAICNSDKYSFCLSVLQMPSAQRNMMNRSFKAEAEQMEEIAKDEKLLNPDATARNIARQYIQDLYRFFRIHPQNADFQDMFDFSLRLHEGIFFDLLCSNSDLKMHVAAYYFNKSHYPEAIALYLELIEEQEPLAANYQKLGFAYQRQSMLQDALDAYLKADMIQPDDVWTVKKIAFCYRIAGDYEKSLEHYRHVNFLQPGSQHIQLQMANCLIALDRHKEALQIYAELEKVNPDDRKIWQATYWCAFVAGNIHQAEYYIDKILNDTAGANDYLNAGHVALCLKKPKQAIDYYRTSLLLFENNMEVLMDQISSDKPHILRNGVKAADLSLLMDELLYLEES